MIVPPAGVRVLIAAKPVDFRKGMDGLAALAKERLAEDPFSGTVLIFRAKRADRVKILVWDGTGLWVCAKRLEKGKFRWPEVSGDQNKVQLSHEELALLLGGIDLRQAQRRRWYRRGVAEEPAA